MDRFSIELEKYLKVRTLTSGTGLPQRITLIIANSVLRADGIKDQICLYQNPLLLAIESKDFTSYSEGSKEIKECFIHCAACNRCLTVLRMDKSPKNSDVCLSLRKNLRKKWQNPNALHEEGESIFDEKEAAKNISFNNIKKKVFLTKFKALVTGIVSKNEASINTASSLYKVSPYLDEHQIIGIS